MPDFQAGRQRDSLNGITLVIAVCLATALETLISQLLLQPLSQLLGPGSQAPELCVTIMIFEVAAIQLVLVSLSDLFRSPLQLIRTLSLCTLLGPWVAASIAIPAIFSITEAEIAIHQAVPCALLVASICGFVGILQAHALLLFTRPSEQIEATPWARSNLSPTLGQDLRQIQWATASSIALLVVAFIWAERGSPLDLIEHGYLNTGVAALGLLVIFSGFCSLRFPSAPDQQLLQLADQLDGINHDDKQTLARTIHANRFDAAGRLIHQVDIIRQQLARRLSEREKALEQCRQSNNQKGEFFAILSQELGTRLQSISELSRVLLEDQQTPVNDAQREDVRLIRTASTQLTAIIQDILDISLIESGELSLNFCEVDTAAIIEETIAILKPMLREKTVNIETDIATDLPTIICDRARIGQILNNLIHNAIKFTSDGIITVAANRSEVGSKISIRVTDTGIGIPSADLDSIFEEYRQLGSRRESNKGTGLGLAIARSIANFHGGTLTAQSQPGEGSTFQLYLPIYPPHNPGNTSKKLAAASEINTSASHKSTDETQ